MKKFFRLKGKTIVKCRRCHVTMTKDPETRFATCPYCGRSKRYYTKAERRNYSRNKKANANEAIGCLILLVILLLLFSLVGSIFGPVLKVISSIAGFLLKSIGAIIRGIFNFIF